MDKVPDEATYTATRSDSRRRNSTVHLGTPRWHLRVTLRRMQMSAHVVTPLGTCLTFDAADCAPYCSGRLIDGRKRLKQRASSSTHAQYAVHGFFFFPPQSDRISLPISGTVYIPHVFSFSGIAPCPRVAGSIVSAANGGRDWLANNVPWRFICFPPSGNAGI